MTSPQHFLNLLDEAPARLLALGQFAREFKAGRRSAAARERVLVQVYFNPSLRTRTSMEVAMLKLGGQTVTLTPGQGMWELEHREGVVMDGAAAEHLREAVPVLARYGDVLAVRGFAAMRSLEEDRQESLLTGFARYSSKPVLNLESAREHPLQGIADLVTLQERFGPQPVGKTFVVTWAPHIKPLPLAVCQSALLAAASLGMNVVLARPEGFHPDPLITDEVARRASACGGSFAVTDRQQEALAEADAVYVKSWGAPSLYGDPQAMKEALAANAAWQVRESSFGSNTRAKVMHCLPVRRNVVIADEVLDGPRSIVIDQAENRLWGQMAVLHQVLSAGEAQP